MNESKIGVRYAKAFFQIAQERSLLNDLKEDIDLIANLCVHKDFKLLLESPVISITKKKSAFKKIVKEEINALTIQFIDMIVENKREIYIADICRNFNSRYMELNGIKSAQFTTATILDPDQKSQISDTIAKLFNTKLEFSAEENSELLGGFILRVGDQQIDASIATKLKKLERDLLNTTL